MPVKKDRRSTPPWTRLRGESGKGRLVTWAALIVVALTVYALVRIVPAYIENYKFAAELRAMARHAHIEKDDNVLRASIQEEARRLEITVLGDDIVIQRDPGEKYVEIRTEYDRPVRFPPFTFTTNLHFKDDALEKM
jgi:hypothetical protein